MSSKTMAEDDRTSTPTVKFNDGPTVMFNVGGKAYETSLALFLKHEDTALGRLVSDRRQVDPTMPIFIDRDGDTFRFVLDYLRYGHITLPMTVSKEMFLLDMDFYGIAYEDGTVKTTAEEWAAQVSLRLDNIAMGGNKLNEGEMHLELLENIRTVGIHVASACIGQWGSRQSMAQFTDSVRKMRSLKSKLDSPSSS
jgi:hypothetical protein